MVSKAMVTISDKHKPSLVKFVHVRVDYIDTYCIFIEKLTSFLALVFRTS